MGAATSHRLQDLGCKSCTKASDGAPTLRVEVICSPTLQSPTSTSNYRFSASLLKPSIFVTAALQRSQEPRPSKEGPSPMFSASTWVFKRMLTTPPSPET